MSTATKSAQASLFQVYLRLRPPIVQPPQGYGERCLTVHSAQRAENPEQDEEKENLAPATPTHITLQPPNDNRKRAVEKFAFTRIFEEEASQLQVFEETGIHSLIKAVLVEARDGLVATLGVTGSGKSHTILGSKSERGITQLALDILFRSMSSDGEEDGQITPLVLASLAASDTSEAQLFSAQTFLEAVYGEPSSERNRGSRAQTPASRSQTPMTDPTPALIFPRRTLQQRPSPLPREPDVSNLSVHLNHNLEYVLLLSMYEVYNDRIFDLLSPSIAAGQGALSRQGGNGQRDRRRALLFKSTEGSPDRKIVAGLRKIACSTYEEALAVLEVGLTERKVTGTGSNSVSSRSHGFFCLEVKRKIKGKNFGEEAWTSNTLTVVDLAGSERARTAKTAGATLAEAGKINESLMYLGQCLQMQTDLQDGNKTALVPFRQCKLTELLFSNSFPPASQTSSASSCRSPQKAIMIVTADPLGDFNATSQILRYSALAREVTVPRIPSVTETILSGSTNLGKTTFISGGVSINTPSAEELDRMAAEIARLTAEYESVLLRLADEEAAREELELKFKSAEERCLMIEQEVREECWVEMDDRVEEERRRWQRAWDEQADHNDEHLDKKIELISRGFEIFEDPEQPQGGRVEELEFENKQLRGRIAALEREITCRSPTKKLSKARPPKALADHDSPTKYKGDSKIVRDSDIENAVRRMDQLKLLDNMFAPAPVAETPGKKLRKLTTRKWDLGPEEEI